MSIDKPEIQDEITSAVNSLGYSLWDLHYDRPSFSFLLELTTHLPDGNLVELSSYRFIMGDE